MPGIRLALFAILFCSPAAYALQLLANENPPLNFTHSGLVAGSSTAVLREAARRANLTAQFSVVPWTEAYSRAQTDADTCVYSTARTAAQAQFFQWIGPISRGSLSAFALADFPGRVLHFDDLANYRIGVVGDDRADYLRGRGLTALVETDYDFDVLARLTADRMKSGGVDLWVTQSAAAGSIARIANVGPIKEVFKGLLSQDYWLACGLSVSPHKIKALRDEVASMRNDGSFHQLTGRPATATSGELPKITPPLRTRNTDLRI